jgi:hypothetical protein
MPPRRAVQRISLRRAQVNKSSGLRFRSTISAGDHGGGAARLWGTRRVVGRMVAPTNAQRKKSVAVSLSLSLCVCVCVPPMTAALEEACLSLCLPPPPL